MITIREYAASRNVTYEAVRRRVDRYADKLGEHVVMKGNTRFLDDKAVEFLDETGKKMPIAIVNEAITEENENLRKQILELQAEVSRWKETSFTIQTQRSELLERLAETEKKQQTLLLEKQAEVDKERTAKELIEKQAEETKAMYERMLEDKTTELNDKFDEIGDLQFRLDGTSAKLSEAETELSKFQKSIFGLWKKRKE